MQEEGSPGGQVLSLQSITEQKDNDAGRTRFVRPCKSTQLEYQGVTKDSQSHQLDDAFRLIGFSEAD